MKFLLRSVFLNHKCLSPSLIERSNVSLAVAIFHESTINGLEHFSYLCPDFNDTAYFLKLILSWWNGVNVKCKFTAEWKRDQSKACIAKPEDCSFLSDFASWLKFWQENSSKENTLSKETYQAAYQTCQALHDLCIYLLKNENVDYILLGSILSDCIERRFGSWRQLNGANYFASVRQFVEGEKSIRLKNLLKYSGVNLTDVKNLFLNSREEILDTELAIFDEKIPNLEELNFEEDDKSAIYYVSGYISRSVSKINKCSHINFDKPLSADLVSAWAKTLLLVPSVRRSTEI